VGEVVLRVAQGVGERPRPRFVDQPGLEQLEHLGQPLDEALGQLDPPPGSGVGEHQGSADLVGAELLGLVGPGGEVRAEAPGSLVAQAQDPRRLAVGLACGLLQRHDDLGTGEVPERGRGPGEGRRTGPPWALHHRGHVLDVRATAP
jgi:hypothetical protein